MTTLPAFLDAPGTGSNRPSVDDLLAEHYSPDEIGGPSPHGWHALADYMQCRRRTYLQEVRGMEPTRARPGLDVGTLMHACLARHYLTSGRDTLHPIEIVEPHYPEYAEVARRIIDKLRTHFWPDEARTWDIRAVEVLLTATLSCPHPDDARRRVSVPITCRCDLLVADRVPGEAPAPSGPVASGVSITDHKFVAAMRRDYLTGFGMNGQLLMNALVYKRGGYERVYGPFQSFIANVVAKTKDPQVERLRVAITDADLARFEAMIRGPAAARYLRLRAPHKRREDTWDMNMAACTGEFRCAFYDYCESHGQYANLYRIRPGYGEAA